MIEFIDISVDPIAYVRYRALVIDDLLVKKGTGERGKKWRGSR